MNELDEFYVHTVTVETLTGTGPYGDTYDTTVANGVVYAASHQHDCSNIGSFPQQRPAQVEWRTVLESTDGPVEHARIVCLNRHWFLLPVEWLRRQP